MTEERKEVAARKTRLQEIFEETRALGGDNYSPFNPSHTDAARQQAEEDAREMVVSSFRRFHQRHAGRMRRRDLIQIFADAAKNMS